MALSRDFRTGGVGAWLAASHRSPLRGGAPCPAGFLHPAQRSRHTATRRHAGPPSGWA